MAEILNQYFTLVLNAYFQVVGKVKIRKALTNLFSTADGANMASLAIDATYPLDENGHVDFLRPDWRLVAIDEWINLPIRDFDLVIHTAKRPIRAPLVIQAKNYEGLAIRELKLNKRNAYHHYKKKCVYTGRELTLAEATLEHWIPLSDGGTDEWENVVLADKSLNNERGNKPILEFRIKPKYRPKKPIPRTAASMLGEIPRPEWEYFLMRNK